MQRHILSPRYLILPVLLSAALLQGCTTTMIALGAATATGITAASVMTDRRSEENKQKDTYIIDQLRARFQNDAGIGADAQIQIDSYNRRVLLTGQVANDAIRLRAAELALALPEVRKVFNEIRLPRPQDEEVEKDFLTSSAIKTALLTNGGSLALNTQVTSNQGVVYLMGLLTRREAAEAVEIVRRINGVIKVVPLFEYVRLVETRDLEQQ